MLDFATALANAQSWRNRLDVFPGWFRRLAQETQA
jgi:hypothetical protein